MDLIADGIRQLYPTLSVDDCTAWLAWVSQQPNYYICRIGQSICIGKVFTQVDPPWLKLAQEVVWTGHGREAVRTLNRTKEWARLQGATHFGYALAPRLDIVKWRKL